jgi:class 3 adenylate cyclase/predicted ATPase
MAGEGAPGDDVEEIDRAVAALEQQRSTLGDAVVEAAVQALRARRARLVPAPGEQRKLVTALFSDLVDSTPLTARLGAETMREVMRSYFGRWRAAIEAEGGVVEKFIGDAVVAVFGTGRAHEDDAHRAVRASLRMVDDLAALDAEVQREHGVGLRMRVGIDTGEVVLGAVGERGDDGPVVVGETMNRAARLQAAAPVGGVLLSAATARHVRGAFALQRLDAARLKGFDGPVEVYQVHSATTQGFWPQTRGIEGVTTRTVGREVELGRLRKAFEDMPSEDCWTVVTLLGHAGIGKTRLLADFETWLAGLPTGVWLLRGRAAPHDESVPYRLLRSVFAERFGVQDTDGPEQVRARWADGLAAMTGGAGGRDEADLVATWLGFGVGDLPQLEAWRSDPQGLQRRARRVLGSLLRHLGTSAPVVLLLEDLHWADTASLEWLQETAASPQGYPVLVVASTRPALLDRRPSWGEGLPGHLTVRLGPLSRRESGELVQDVLQRADHVPEQVRRLVVDASEGNPFFIEELVAWLIDQGVVRTGPDGWTVQDDVAGGRSVPGTLRGVLQARLDSLGTDERDVVDRASVIGRVFWDRAVEHLGPGRPPAPGGPGDPYQRLRSREVVHQRPTSAFDRTREFSFRHALLRDVAYDGLLRPRRRRYHSLAARWMQEAVGATGRADEHAGTIAHHLLQAGEDAAAAPWLLSAGRHAARAYAGDQALALLRQAAALVPDDDAALRFEVLLEQEKVLDRTGAREAQREVLDLLPRAAGDDPGRQAQAELARGRWLFFHSDYAAAVPVAEHATALARQAGRHDVEVQALVLAGRSLAFRGDHLAAREHLHRVLPRAQEVGSPRDVAETQRLLGVVATNLHEEQVAAEVLGRAVAGFRAAADLEGEALATGQLAALHLLTGRLDAARRASEDALAIFVSTGHRMRQGMVLGNLVSIAMEQGRLDDALRTGRETLALTEELDDAEGVVSTLLRLGEAARLTGDLGTAREQLGRSVLLGERYELDYFVAFALFSRVLVELDDGEVPAARAAADAAVAAARRSEVPAATAHATFCDGLVQVAEGGGGAVGTLRDALEQHLDLGVQAHVRECRAALAGALLDAGGHGPAGDLARVVADEVLAGGDPRGGLEPSRPLLEVHRVLTALGDPRAGAVAAAAGRFLDERAGLVADPEVRAALLSSRAARLLRTVAAGAADAPRAQDGSSTTSSPTPTEPARTTRQ